MQTAPYFEMTSFLSAPHSGLLKKRSEADTRRIGVLRSGGILHVHAAISAIRLCFSSSVIFILHFLTKFTLTKVGGGSGIFKIRSIFVIAVDRFI